MMWPGAIKPSSFPPNFPVNILFAHFYTIQFLFLPQSQAFTRLCGLLQLNVFEDGWESVLGFLAMFH